MEVSCLGPLLLLFTGFMSSADCAPHFVYAKCDVKIDGPNPAEKGLIIVDHQDACKKWVCNTITKKGFIESCEVVDLSAKCEDIDIYNKQCYKGEEDGDSNEVYPKCCATQVEICPGSEDYDPERFRAENEKYAREEPFLWCARDSP